MIDYSDTMLGRVQQQRDDARLERDAANARAETAEAKLLSVRESLADMIDERDAALAEAERLRAQVATLRADVALMLRTPHNHDWLPNDDCQRCAVEQRLADNTRQDVR